MFPQCSLHCLSAVCRLFVTADNESAVYNHARFRQGKTITVKALRLAKHWSQDELAQMSNLNVRTIQRVEKGQSVGTETLRALAAVFEITTDELVEAIESEKRAELAEEEDKIKTQSSETKALEKVKSIKYFYAFSAFLIAVFLLFMLPNYNGGENLGPLIVVFLSFSALIAIHAVIVFQPFGEEWEKEKVAQIMKKQSGQHDSDAE